MKTKLCRRPSSPHRHLRCVSAIVSALSPSSSLHRLHRRLRIAPLSSPHCAITSRIHHRLLIIYNPPSSPHLIIPCLCIWSRYHHFMFIINWWYVTAIGFSSCFKIGLSSSSLSRLTIFWVVLEYLVKCLCGGSFWDLVLIFLTDFQNMVEVFCICGEWSSKESFQWVFYVDKNMTTSFIHLEKDLQYLIWNI